MSNCLTEAWFLIKLEGLLAAGRCFSSDQAANSMFNVISHCTQMGQAAGTAAALAVKSKVLPRKVNIKDFRNGLLRKALNCHKKSGANLETDKYQKEFSG